MFTRSEQLALSYLVGVLNTPYPGAREKRGSIIYPPGKYQHYPADQMPKEVPGAVYRPQHGLAHTAHVMANVQSAVELCIAQYPQLDLAALFNDAEVEKLTIAAAFCDAARESNAAFSFDYYSDYQHYVRNSARKFAQFTSRVTTQGRLLERKFELNEHETLLFSPEEIERYTEALSTPCTYEDLFELKTSHDMTEKEKRAAAKLILAIAQSADGARYKDISSVTHTLQSLQINIVDYAVIALLERNEIQLILMGDQNHFTFNPTLRHFETCNMSTRNALFQIASTNPDVCCKLLTLSGYIKTAKQALLLAAELNYHAISGQASFDAFLNEALSIAEESDDKIKAFLESHNAFLTNVDAGRVFKVIDVELRDTYVDFVKSIVDPTYRPELRRLGERKEFSSRLSETGAEYETVPNNRNQRTPRLPPDEKIKWTRAQSTSYSNFYAGMVPPPFGDYAAEDLPCVGVSFHLKDCLFQRIMMYYAATFGHPYDHETEEAAKSYAEKQLAIGNYHLSVPALQQYVLLKNPHRITELMTRLRWNTDGTSHITIFADNIRSRLLAQICALDLKSRLEMVYQQVPIDIPISFYPDYRMYHPTEKQKDLEEARQHQPLRGYVIAYTYLSDKQRFSANEEKYHDLIEAHNVLKKINPDGAKAFHASIMKDKLQGLMIRFDLESKKPENEPFFNTFNQSEINKVKANPSENIALIEFILELLDRKKARPQLTEIFDHIKSFSEFLLYLKTCDNKNDAITLACQHAIIRTALHFQNVITILNNTETTHFIETLSTKARNLIISANDFIGTTRSLSADNFMLFLKIIDKRLLSIAMQSAHNFYSILKQLEQHHRVDHFLNSIKEEAKNNHQTLNEQHFLLLGASNLWPETKLRVFTILKPEFIDSITNFSALVSVITLLSYRNRELMFDLLNTTAPMMKTLIEAERPYNIAKAISNVFTLSPRREFFSLYRPVSNSVLNGITSLSIAITFITSLPKNLSSSSITDEHVKFLEAIIKKAMRMISTEDEFMEFYTALADSKFVSASTHLLLESYFIQNTLKKLPTPFSFSFLKYVTQITQDHPNQHDVFRSHILPTLEHILRNSPRELDDSVFISTFKAKQQIDILDLIAKINMERGDEIPLDISTLTVLLLKAVCDAALYDYQEKHTTAKNRNQAKRPMMPKNGSTDIRDKTMRVVFETKKKALNMHQLNGND